MEAHVYRQFAELEESHFWFRGRRSIFFRLLDDTLGEAAPAAAPGATTRRVLEIGCGTGGMLSPLSRYGDVTAMDIAHDALQHCRTRGFHRLVTGSGYQLPFADRTFDVVALFDTIEHIPDDARVLAEVHRVLRPGGIVIVSVPAYQFLYSQNDRVVHHQRRYTASMLRQRFRAAGLQPAKVTYFNTFLFPLILPAVLVLKLKERMFGLPEGQTHLNHRFAGPINELFAWFMSSERHLLRRIEFPFGHSLIAIGRGAPARAA